MLTVIIETGDKAHALPALLAALTPAAVSGLVRQVLVAAPEPTDLALALCEECGADLVRGGIAEAAVRARSDRLLVLPPDIRFPPGWIENLMDHLGSGGPNGIVPGEATGGLFKRLWARPSGALISKGRLEGLAHPDLEGLRRHLGGRAVRLGQV
jgi:hypothetical protein